MPPGLTFCRCERPHAERRLTDRRTTRSGHPYAGWPLRGSRPPSTRTRGAPTVTDTPCPCPCWTSSASSTASGHTSRWPARSGSRRRSSTPATGATGSPSTTTCAAWPAARRRSSPRTSPRRPSGSGSARPGSCCRTTPPFKVAETFRTLMAMHPGRIDLGLGRAPGTDPLTAHVLRRGIDVDAAARVPRPGRRAARLPRRRASPTDHPYARLVAAPVVDERPELFVLGSSGYGTRFAAVNGMSAVFAHHMSPDLAVRRAARLPPALPPAARRRRAVLGDVGAGLRQRRPGGGGRVRGRLDADHAEPAPQHPRAAAPRGGRGVRAVRPSSAPPRGARTPGWSTGEAKPVVERLLEIKEQAQVDEIVVVTPPRPAPPDRQLPAIADAWRAAA